MKTYGTFVATDIDRKKVKSLWAMAKRGTLVVEHWFGTELFRLANYFGYESEKAEQREKQVLNILDALDEHHVKTAQELIYKTTSQWYNEMSDKQREQISRAKFVE